MKKFFLILSFIYLFLFSCSNHYSKTSKFINQILCKNENAIDYLEQKIEETKIIFVGSTDHSSINDTIFFNYNTICKLYEKGLRYILLEGGLQDKKLYNSDDFINKNIILFYPWESVGVQYVENSIIDNILKVNQTIARHDPIKIIGLEGGRKNFSISDHDKNKIYNYRDQYMFQTTLEYIKNSKTNDKFLILCGADHGCKNIIKQFNHYDGLDFNWYTLAYYLSNEFQENFLSLSFITLDSYTNDSIYYKNLSKSNWNKTDYQSKLLNIKDIEKINKKIFILDNENYKGFDNFIVDKQAKYGIKYCYKLSDKYVLNSVITRTKELYHYFSNKNQEIDYNNVDESYKLEEFTRNLYYLKYTFGDNFPYTFWNPKIKLIEAFEYLQNNPYPIRTFSDKETKKYQLLIRGMYYLQKSNDKESIKFYLKNGTWQMEQAKSIFPDEIWSDYWFLIMNYRLGKYKNAYKYCTKLLTNELTYSSICLPEILSLENICAKKINIKNNKTQKYKLELMNELDIDVSQLHLFLY